MTTKAIISRNLTQAADALARVNLLVDLAPRQNVSAALGSAIAAYDMLQKGKFRQAAKLKTSVQAVAAIDKALKQNRTTLEGDQQLLVRAMGVFRDVASTLAEPAPAPAPEAASVPAVRREARVLKTFGEMSPEEFVPPTPVVPVSAAVASSADDLNVGDLDKVMSAINEAAKAVKKLPRSVEEGRWVVKKAPVLVYSHSFIPDIAFTRLGIDRDKYTKIGQALSFKRKGASQHGYLLEDQLVIGFDKDDALFDTERKAGIANKRARGVDPSKLMGRKKVKTEGIISRAIAALSARLGNHFNVLSERDPPYIVMQGNPLVWVWVLPTRAGLDFAPKIADASFPVLSAQNYEVKQRNMQALKKELQELEAMRDMLAKKKQVLEPEKLARYLELHRIVHGEEIKQELTPEQKRERLAQLRNQLDAEVTEKFAKQFGEIEDLQDQLKEETDKTEQLRIRREIKRLEAQIAQGREKLSVKYRSKLK